MTALLTIAEVADELRLSPDSVRRLVASGKLPVVYPVARRPRIARAALMAYIDRITPSDAPPCPIARKVVHTGTSLSRAAADAALSAAAARTTAAKPLPIGAGSETRTRTVSLPVDFESNCAQQNQSVSAI